MHIWFHSYCHWFRLHLLSSFWRRTCLQPALALSLVAMYSQPCEWWCHVRSIAALQEQRHHPGTRESESEDTASSPHIEWWASKVFESIAMHHSATRNVGRLCPSNLVPRGQVPIAPYQLRCPVDLGVTMALADLENNSNVGVNVKKFKDIHDALGRSFECAMQSVLEAAKAYESLCRNTQQIELFGDAAAREKLKKAKICARDVVLWRWFGFTGWIYNHPGQEFFEVDVPLVGSQFHNGVAKIRQQLMQHLMTTPSWHRLEDKLLECAGSGSWTPEFAFIFQRLRCFHCEIEGLSNDEYLDQFRLSHQDHQDLKDSVADQHAEASDKEFEHEVYCNASHTLAASMVNDILNDAAEITSQRPTQGRTCDVDSDEEWRRWCSILGTFEMLDFEDVWVDGP